MQNKQNSSSRLLAQSIGISQKTLRDAYKARESYVVHRIKKRSGGFRVIHEPPEILKYVQKRILACIFYPLFRNDCIDKRMFGFLPHRSIADNAYNHTKQPWNFLYKIDLKDAFPSIDSLRIAIALRTLILENTQINIDTFLKDEEVYNERISQKGKKRRRLKGVAHSKAYKIHALSFKSIIGRNPETAWFRKMLLGSDEQYAEAQFLIIKVVDIIADICTLPSGVLPQGAPTSGFLLTVVATHVSLLDIIQSNLYNLGAHQTRVSMYADDVAFSTMKKISWNDMQKVIGSIESIGIWDVNKSKIYEYNRNSTGPVVCGIRIGRYRIYSEKQRDVFWNEIDVSYNTLCERIKEGGSWSVDFVTSPKKLKKKIRALEYKLSQNPDDDILRRTVLGYRAYIVDIKRKSRLPFNIFKKIR